MGTLTKMVEQQPTKFDQNCTSSEYDAFTDDHQLKQAAEQAERMGSEMPLVREQLRTKIQLDRLKKGKGELTIQFEEPRKYELTPEEKEKQEKRKMRNREAAKNSRNRKKRQHSQLQKENKALKDRNSKLHSQVDKLRDYLDHMQKGIKQTRICSSAYHPHVRRQYLTQSLPLVAPQSHVKARPIPSPLAVLAPHAYTLNHAQGLPIMDIQAEETVVSTPCIAASGSPGRPASAELERTSPMEQDTSTSLTQEDVEFFVASLSGNTLASHTITTSFAESSDSQTYALPQSQDSPQPQQTAYFQVVHDEPQGYVSKIKTVQIPFTRYSPYNKPGSSPGTPPLGLGTDRLSTDSQIPSPDSLQDPQALFRAMQGLNRGQ